MFRLKELRKNANFTQEQISHRLGITRGAYANIENGRREPDLNTLNTLATIYGVSIDYLTGRCSEELKSVPLPDAEARLLDYYQNLNEEGQEKLLEYADDLVSLGRYKKHNPLSQGKMA